MSRKLQPPDSLLTGMHGERDARGFLVTHVVYREQDGTPVLKLADIEKAASCMAERRCQTCGLPISTDEMVGFIGFVGDIEFREAPIHLRCADYSFSICPHLLARTRARSVIIVVCHDYEYLPRSTEDIETGMPARCRPLGLGDSEEFTPEELTAYLSPR